MISNQEFNELLKNEHYLSIINAVALKFDTLDEDEVEAEKSIILWEAASKFDVSKNTKFTTYLYSYAYWRFFAMKNNDAVTKFKHKNIKLSEHIKYDDSFLEYFPDNCHKLIHQRYLEQMTLQKLGEYYDCSAQNIYLRLEKILREAAEVV